MHVKLWGTRGSIPCPGADTVRYGGNTSCVQVTLSDGTHVVLDAGTGIRNLTLPDDGPQRVHILLTHLHLDHIQGLLFFPPLFRRDSTVTIWGPAAPDGSLRDRVARYLSAPLSPVEVRELPSQLSFRACPDHPWEIGSARVRADGVNHRGPTVGYRIEDAGAAIAYIPDHEPALAGPVAGLDEDWISGLSLARDADLLICDCQYRDDEYALRFGWGHSCVSDALWFAHRARARDVLLTHHDPSRSDADLDALLAVAATRWRQIGGEHPIALARELHELDVVARAGAR